MGLSAFAFTMRISEFWVGARPPPASHNAASDCRCSLFRSIFLESLHLAVVVVSRCARTLIGATAIAWPLSAAAQCRSASVECQTDGILKCERRPLPPILHGRSDLARKRSLKVRRNRLSPTGATVPHCAIARCSLANSRSHWVLRPGGITTATRPPDATTAHATAAATRVLPRPTSSARIRPGFPGRLLAIHSRLYSCPAFHAPEVTPRRAQSSSSPETRCQSMVGLIHVPSSGIVSWPNQLRLIASISCA